MEQNNNFKWYILNVMAGQEKKIAGDIKTLIMKKEIVFYTQREFKIFKIF